MTGLALLLALFSQESVQSMIDRLNAECIEARERAMADLLDAGAVAESALKEAQASPHLEIALRAGMILAELHRYRLEVFREVIHLMSHALESFQDRRLEESRQFCGRVLQVDPQYAQARKLWKMLQKMESDEGDPRSLEAELEEWGRTVYAVSDGLPRRHALELPAFSSWPDLRRSAVVRHDGKPGKGSRAEQVRRKLATLQMEVAFENTGVEDILAFIRDCSGLNILFDAQCTPNVDPNLRLTFKAKGLDTGTVLTLLLSRFGLGFRVTDDAVVLISRVP